MRTKTRRGATVAGLAAMVMAGGVLAAPPATSPKRQVFRR